MCSLTNDTHYGVYMSALFIQTFPVKLSDVHVHLLASTDETCHHNDISTYIVYIMKAAMSKYVPQK